MTLRVTHWLLHHHVTVEFQGSMGKFVQLSTQIRTYRNCRGRWERGASCVCVCVCPCVYMETQVSLRTDRTLETCEKKESKSSLSQKINSSYCVGGIPEAEGETPPCILHRAELIPLAEQTSPWHVSIRLLSVFLQGSSPNLTSELKDKGKLLIKYSLVRLSLSPECLFYLKLKDVEQNQAHILSPLADLVSADPFLPFFLLLEDFWVLLFCISAKGQKVRNLDAAGCVWCGLERQLRWSPTCCELQLSGPVKYDINAHHCKCCIEKPWQSRKRRLYIYLRPG